MMASVFIATSLDGFIARPDGGIDWLTTDAGKAGGEDFGYAEFMQGIDALVMGRRTFEAVLTFGDWPYGELPVVVLSSAPVRIPPSLPGTVECMNAPPKEVVRALSARGFSHLYVDGGRTIQSFLEAGLIHQLILTRVPVLLGSGIPLFGPLPCDFALSHVETRTFANGFVQSRYEVKGQVLRAGAPAGSSAGRA